MNNIINKLWKKQAGTNSDLVAQDLINICTLGDKSVVHNKALGYYKHIVSGCDWGVSDYNRATHTKESYTVHVMLGITNDGKFDIIHMRRYSGMGYREIAGLILADHKRLGGNALASDFGVGAASNTLLRASLDADQHIIFRYTGPDNAEVEAADSEYAAGRLNINRQKSLTKLFEAIRENQIRCYEWEDAEASLSDCLNTTLVQRENAFRYVRTGTGPTNTLHALNFAFTLGKILLGEYPDYKRK